MDVCGTLHSKYEKDVADELRHRYSDLPRRPISRLAQVDWMLALAHYLQGAIDRGLVADRAAVARKLELTRARVTQLLDLLMLAPDLQVTMLTLKAVDGAAPMAERTLRAVAHAETWGEQRAAWAPLRS